MNLSEQDMINIVKRDPFIKLDTKAGQLLDNPDITDKVLLELARNCRDEEVAKKIAKHPKCQENTIITLLQRLDDMEIHDAELLDEIVKSNALGSNGIANILLIRSMYDKTILRALFRSGKVTEDQIKDYVSKPRSYDERVWNDILKAPNLTPGILKAITTYDVSPDILLKIVNNPKANGEVAEKVLYTACGGMGKYSEIMDSIIASDKVNRFVLVSVLGALKDNNLDGLMSILKSDKCTDDMVRDKYAHRGSIAKKHFLASPNCPSDVLLDCAKDFEGVNDFLVRHPNANEEVLIAAIDTMKNNLYYYQRNYERILNIVAARPDLTPKTMVKLIEASSGNFEVSSVKAAVQKHPNKDKSVNMALLANTGHLTKDKIEALVNDPSFTKEDIVALLNGLPESSLNKELLLYFADCDKESPELYKAIIDKAYATKNMSDELFDKIIKLDLKESTLVDICKKDHLVSHISKAMEHKNASLKMVAVINTLSDQFKDETREKLTRKAQQLKRRIIESVYHVEEEKNVTDILRRNVDRGLSTMLWGPSGVGKSARVFEVDPTATMLILKNSMLPEDVVGGREPNGEPGKIYPPHWYTVLKEKCEKEPDRMHILFIDEFTNVKDNVKNLVWEVIGNRTVNGHEEWTLPKNCSVVVAGNRPEESTAVTIDAAGGVMPAPLHNRIDSMLEIGFDLDEWQKWALETNPETGRLRIHPIVYSFCVAHADKVMFSGFNPEAITQPFLTPRKWERLSDAIYACEKDDPLRHLGPITLKSILGDNEIGYAFQEHYDRLPMDMDMITYGKYTEDDFPTIEDKLYALGMVISAYNGDEEAAKDFVATCLGDEYSSIYETMASSRKAVLESNKGKSI